MDSQEIEARAARWVIRQHNEDWTPADAGELDRWLDESTAHRVSYIRLQSALQQLDRLQVMRGAVASGGVPAPGSWNAGADRGSSHRSAGNARVRFKLWPSRLSIAAAVALLSVGGFYLVGIQSWGEERFTTRVGGLETVKLADGSTLNLNTNTRVRVALRPTERLVHLDSGEAYFVVAKDQSRPFVVTVADKSVTAVGTAFSVRRSADADVQILVTEGQVQLRLAQRNRPEDTTPLSAGKMARTRNEEVLIHDMAEGEIQRLLSWRSGFLTFRDTPLPEAVAEFNRYTAQKLVITDAALDKIRIGGKFRDNNVQTFLALLQEGFPVSVEATHDQILLKHRN